jgi:hypothetical protein
MKKFIVIMISCILAVNAYSQEETAVDVQTSRKLTKEQRIELRKINEAAMAKTVDSIVEARKFVLEANYLSNQTGRRVNVNSLINFIIIDSAKITIQIASTTGYGGPNGMGGITTTGRISSFKVNKTGRDKSNYSVRLTAMTTVGIFDIFLNISPSSNADATLSGITPGKLNYFGNIKPLGQSKVFKGMST